MYYIVSFIISAGALFFIANSPYIGGMTLGNGYTSALIFAVVLAIVNLTLGTLLRIITFPIRLITLGLFSFIISIGLVYLTDMLIPTVTIDSYITLIIIAITTTIISFVMKIFK